MSATIVQFPGSDSWPGDGPVTDRCCIRHTLEALELRIAAALEDPHLLIDRAVLEDIAGDAATTFHYIDTHMLREAKP